MGDTKSYLNLLRQESVTKPASLPSLGQPASGSPTSRWPSSTLSLPTTAPKPTTNLAAPKPMPASAAPSLQTGSGGKTPQARAGTGLSNLPSLASSSRSANPPESRSSIGRFRPSISDQMATIRKMDQQKAKATAPHGAAMPQANTLPALKPRPNPDPRPKPIASPADYAWDVQRTPVTPDHEAARIHRQADRGLVSHGRAESHGVTGVFPGRLPAL